MVIIDWWAGLQRQYRNAFAVAVADVIVLCLFLFNTPGSSAVWEWLTGRLPNFYDIFFLQFIALIRGVSPAAVVASSAFVTVTTTFMTLLTVHVLVALGTGLLFQKLEQTKAWSLLNYLVLFIVLFVLHVVIVTQTPLLT